MHSRAAFPQHRQAPRFLRERGGPDPGLQLHQDHGRANLKRASQLAVLNANYIKERLKATYTSLMTGPACTSAFSRTRTSQAQGHDLDIAKRLMDYGFHPPTIYFPLVVNGAIMIERRNECKEDLDRSLRPSRIAEEPTTTLSSSIRRRPSRS